MNREFLIVGLGNPGKEYEHTRHNVGFLVVDELARRYKPSGFSLIDRALVAESCIDGHKAILAKPVTYMNNSGQAVKLLLRRYNLEYQSSLIVIYDDLDLPFGTIRVRTKGSSGGHRGVQSIIDTIGSNEFLRVRVGIGRDPKLDPVDYVLGRWNKEQLPYIDHMITHAADAVESLIKEGVEITMNSFNTKSTK